MFENDFQDIGASYTYGHLMMDMNNSNTLQPWNKSIQFVFTPKMTSRNGVKQLVRRENSNSIKKTMTKIKPVSYPKVLKPSPICFNSSFISSTFNLEGQRTNKWETIHQTHKTLYRIKKQKLTINLRQYHNLSNNQNSIQQSINPQQMQLMSKQKIQINKINPQLDKNQSSRSKTFRFTRNNNITHNRKHRKSQSLIHNKQKLIIESKTLRELQQLNRNSKFLSQRKIKQTIQYCPELIKNSMKAKDFNYLTTFKTFKGLKALRTKNNKRNIIIHGLGVAI